MQQRVITVILLVGLGFALITLVSGMAAWRLPDHEQGYAPKQPIDYSHRLHAGELQIDCKFCHSAAETSRHAGIPSTDVCMKCHTLIKSSFDVWKQQIALEDELKKVANSAANGTVDAAQDNPVTEPATGEAAEPEAATGDSTTDNSEPDIPETADQLQQRLDQLEIPSKELKKLYQYLALDDQLQPIEGTTPKSIPWVRVHDLPDYVYFDHRAHVAAGVTCQHCHGPVESMQRMEQFSSLSMGWCVNCHRDATKNGVNGRTVHASTDCAICHY